MNTTKNVQGLSLVPGVDTGQYWNPSHLRDLLVDTLSLNSEHRSRVQDDAKLILNNLCQSQLVPFLDRLEALANLRILSKRFELLEQAEILEPVFSSDTLRDQVGKFRVGLMNKSSGSDTYERA